MSCNGLGLLLARIEEIKKAEVWVFGDPRMGDLTRKECREWPDYKGGGVWAEEKGGFGCRGLKRREEKNKPVFLSFSHVFFAKTNAVF